MTGAPFSLMLVVPQDRVRLPAATSDDVHWVHSVDEEDGEESWEAFQGGPEDLGGWRQAKRMSEDAPLVSVEHLAYDQEFVPLAGHALLRCGLSTSMTGYVRPPPQSWAVARKVVEALGVTFAWSASEDALNLRSGQDPVPWSRCHSTMIFSDAFLRELRLDSTDLEVFAGGGDVYRLMRFGEFWLVQSPEGLGNESAALSCRWSERWDAEDQALMFALQRVSALHQDAVQVWLDGGARRRGVALRKS